MCKYSSMKILDETEGDEELEDGLRQQLRPSFLSGPNAMEAFNFKR